MPPHPPSAADAAPAPLAGAADRPPRRPRSGPAVSRRTVLAAGIAGAAALAAGGATAAGFRAAMARAEARVSTGSQVIPTAWGDLEWAEAGEGPPLLMIHGTGGGFDQGLGFGRRLAAAGHRVIAPSRFGYLRSGFPADAGSAAQADALVALLDHLGLDRLPVAGGSAGALPAIEMAIRHPDRCSALLALVPAAWAPERPTHVPLSPTRERAMRAMLGSDLLFWSALQAVPDLMIGTMLATDPALVAAASPEERARVRAILEDILPVSRRARGLLNDARLAGDPAPQALDRIRCPTLALSVRDDRFGTWDAARHIAASVPGARFVGFPTGGHVWVGHDAAVSEAIGRFLREAAA